MSIQLLIWAVFVSLPGVVSPPPTNGTDDGLGGVLKAAEAFYRGESAFSDGKWDDALREYNTAIKLNPKCAAYFNRRGTVWLAKREWEKARRDYDTAIRLEPSVFEAYISRSVALTNLGQHKEAITDLNQALALAPDVVAIILFCKDASKVQKEYDKAIAWLRKRALAKSLDDFTKAIERSPEYAYSYIERGWVLLQMGQIDEALKDLNTTIKIDPRSALAYQYRSSAWYHKGEWDKALADVNKAIQLAPNDSGGYYYRSRLWRVKGELDKAIADANTAIKLDPAEPLNYFMRATVWECKLDNQKALADYTEGLRLDPMQSDLRVRRGRLLVKMKLWDRALADYNQALKVDPEDLGALTYRSCLRSCCPEGKYRDGKRAIEDARRACELLKWNNPKAIEFLGKAYAEDGQFDEAIKWQRKALEDPAYQSSEGEEATEIVNRYEQKKPIRFSP